MTLPSQEAMALERTREFLRSLLTSNLTHIRKNARSIRKEASSCLRHYPWQHDIDELWVDRIKNKEPWTDTYTSSTAQEEN